MDIEDQVAVLRDLWRISGLKEKRRRYDSTSREYVTCEIRELIEKNGYYEEMKWVVGEIRSSARSEGFEKGEISAYNSPTVKSLLKESANNEW